MSRSTISTFKLFELFPDEPSARKYLEARLWKDGVTCPECAGKDRITIRKDGYYRCNACKLDFTIRTGTVFGKSHIKLHVWMHALYLIVTARKGVSSLQMAKELGVRQGTAWFMLQRLREACSTKGELLAGTVEVDETFVTGKESSRHMIDRVRKPRERADKAIVVGIRQRGGNTVAKVVKSTGGLELRAAVSENVAKGSKVFTDGYSAYQRLKDEGYTHDSVDHIVEEYRRGDVHTNSIESVWAVLKRGIHSTFHHVSKKHLNRYVQEFAFRLNDGRVENHTWTRMDALVKMVAGKRITYKTLTEEITQ